MRASHHARARSQDRYGKAHSVGTAVRIAMKNGLVLPYDDRPGVVLVVARDGRRRVVDLVADEVITALPCLPRPLPLRRSCGGTGARRCTVTRGDERLVGT